MAVKDYAISIGLELGKRKLGEKTDRMKLRSALENYIHRQTAFNYDSAIEEEIDFEGLSEFIKVNLLDELERYLNETSPKERERIREAIIARASAHAKVRTAAAQHRVTKYVSDLIKIIKGFYKQKLPIEKYILVAEAVDAVNENTDQGIKEVKRDIEKLTDSLSPERVTIVPKHMPDAEKQIQRDIAHASADHPLFPDYVYDYYNGRLHSVPQTPEAVVKYPPTLQVDAFATMGKMLIPELNKEAFEYAYRHQESMTLYVKEAEKRLGEELDPDQSEAESLVGKTLVFRPNEFPPAVPCSIAAGDTVFYDYILIRQQEITDDGTYVFGNSEQGIDICFEISTRFQAQGPDVFSFSPSFLSGSIKEAIKYEEFTLALWKGEPLRIKNLSKGEMLLEGHVTSKQADNEIDSLYEELEFLRKIRTVEQYFHIEFVLGHEYTDREERTIEFFAQLIRDGEITRTWKQRSFVGPMSEAFRQNLKKNGNIEFKAKMVMNEKYNVFGSEFDVQYECVLNDMKYKDYDALVEMAGQIENGQDVKLDFVPGNDNTATYRLLEYNRDSAQ